MRAPVAGSPLVRLLGEWNPVDVEASGADFAERLSVWVNAFDAIGLQSAHQAIRGLESRAPGRATRPGSGVALADDLQRVRGVLARSIAQAIAPADEGADAYVPYRDRHRDLQRQMELMIAPLRTHVREAASRRSARLRQLAALDAAMEQVLAEREQGLWPLLPGLLKRRFEQLRSDAADDEDKDWLGTFGREWRQALLAELDVRLAPIAGLVEATASEWDETR